MGKQKDDPPGWKCTYPGCTAEYATSGALDRHVADAHPQAAS